MHFILVRDGVDLKPIPGTLETRDEYTSAGISGSFMASCTHTYTLSVTEVQFCIDNPTNIRMKPENPEEMHMETGRTCESPHRRNPTQDLHTEKTPHPGAVMCPKHSLKRKPAFLYNTTFYIIVQDSAYALKDKWESC